MFEMDDDAPLHETDIKYECGRDTGENYFADLVVSKNRIMLYQRDKLLLSINLHQLKKATLREESQSMGFGLLGSKTFKYIHLTFPEVYYYSYECMVEYEVDDLTFRVDRKEDQNENNELTEKLFKLIQQAKKVAIKDKLILDQAKQKATGAFKIKDYGSSFRKDESHFYGKVTHGTIKLGLPVKVGGTILTVKAIKLSGKGEVADAHKGQGVKIIFSRMLDKKQLKRLVGRELLFFEKKAKQAGVSAKEIAGILDSASKVGGTVVEGDRIEGEKIDIKDSTVIRSEIGAKSKKKKFCPNCGMKLGENWKVCANCGGKL